MPWQLNLVPDGQPDPNAEHIPVTYMLGTEEQTHRLRRDAVPGRGEHLLLPMRRGPELRMQVVSERARFLDGEPLTVKYDALIPET